MLAPVQIIRVHDVYEHFQFSAVLSEINKYRRHD
jgi:dihydropteroate synthase